MRINVYHTRMMNLKPFKASAGRQIGDNLYYYFAYGANVYSATLKRRKIDVSQSHIAQVTKPNIALVFGHRGGYASLAESPVSANNGSAPWSQWRWLDLPLRPNEHAELTDDNANKHSELVYWKPYGVLYELSAEQLEAIAAKEIGYRRSTVSVSFFDKRKESEINADAIVFISSPWMVLRRPVPPTQRYRDLILQGAQERSLPKEYLEWLEDLPAVPTYALSNAEYSNTPAEAAAKILGAAVLLSVTAACLS